MKPAPLILLLMAAPAFAGGGMFSAWRRDCDEPRGAVDHWPEVRRARDVAKLCPAQQFAIFEREKMMLEAAAPSLYRPRHAAPSATTAPAPPPPSVPTIPFGQPEPARPERNAGGGTPRDGRTPPAGGGSRRMS